MAYKEVLSAEGLGVKKLVQMKGSPGYYMVLDKGESDQVILVPFAWDHRILVNRDEIIGEREL